jgi:hypothetical protein
MWAILMGGTWYMKRWKNKHEPALSDREADETSGTELESQTVRLDDAKVGKVSVAGPVV